MTDLAEVNPELVHCGVDWITVTASGGEKALHLYEAGALLCREAVSLGNKKSGWSMSGFGGWSTQGVQFGRRGEEAIVRLSSDLSRELWKEVYDDSDNCTRIDVQATFRVGCEVTPVINRHFAQAKRMGQGRRRTPTVSMLSTNNGPSTLYLNRRCSEAFARIYDKGAESKLKEFENCIRYEVEFKGDEARRVSAYLRNQKAHQLVAGRMAIDFLARKGVCLGKAQIYY